MSIRANPMVIGAFVIGAVVLLLAALLVWGGSGLFRTKLEYVLFFDSAVTGLNKGSPVLARGVKVGEVTDIQLRWGFSSACTSSSSRIRSSPALVLCRDPAAHVVGTVDELGARHLRAREKFHRGPIDERHVLQIENNAASARRREQLL